MMRDQIGYDNTLMMDANQIWDVPQVSVILIFIMVSSQIRFKWGHEMLENSELFITPLGY